MAFTVEDFHDLVRLLEERPAWRTELRRLVLSEELLTLPEKLAELHALTNRCFQELAEAQARTEERLTTLTAAQAKTEEQLTALTKTVRVLDTDVGELKGKSLEAEFRTKVYAYCGRLLRRVHVLSPDELASILEDAIDAEAISQEQAEEIAWADAIVRGKRPDDSDEVYLVVEVSWGIGLRDVERAIQRASLFARTGREALPLVAGKRITPDARRLAQEKQVAQVTNGRVRSLDSL